MYCTFKPGRPTLLKLLDIHKLFTCVPNEYTSTPRMEEWDQEPFSYTPTFPCLPLMCKANKTKVSVGKFQTD